MHDTPTTPLPSSWLTSRLGVNPREIEELRKNGELFAVRGQDEWLYPAWQFGPGGSIPAGVRNAVKAARAVGLDEARLVALLRRPVGLVGGGRLLDLLFEGRSDFVVDAVRNGPNGVNRVRGPRTLAPCASCSSRRCTRGRTRPTSGRSSRRSSASSRRGGTRSSSPSSTRARAGSSAI